RTTDVKQQFPQRSPWTFSTFSLDEIERLDAGSWFVQEDPFGEIAASHVSSKDIAAMRGEHIPTLRSALQLTKDLNWRINLELKRQPAPQDHFPLVEAVLALVEEVGIPEDRVIFSSFVHDWLRQSQSLCPRIEVQALVGYHEDVPLDWSHLDFATYNARYTLITPDEVRALEGQGIHINLFTVNDPEDWRRFTEAGVSGIITDFPQQLLAFLQRQDRERLVSR
ncbi:MAG: glycerophosphodiester phosphodiesterase, partial [Chloroflexi bacterium]|nr:glycerophosphodiester phosphodiesterase [Chloroflexota bacterium]